MPTVTVHDANGFIVSATTSWSSAGIAKVTFAAPSSEFVCLVVEAEFGYMGGYSLSIQNLGTSAGLTTVQTVTSQIEAFIPATHAVIPVPAFSDICDSVYEDTIGMNFVAHSSSQPYAEFLL